MCRSHFGIIVVLFAPMLYPFVGGCGTDPCMERVGNTNEPIGLMLTWQQDPSTTMTIDWHAPPGSSSTLRYRRTGSGQQQIRMAIELDFPELYRSIFRVELVDLDPDSTYMFRVGDYKREFRFRTLPLQIDDRPIVFAAGGDTRHSQAMMERMNRVAMQYDPDFIVWGGDFAYADSNPLLVGRWCEWFNAVMNTLIDENGRVVPIITAIGNHEVRDGYVHRSSNYQQTDEWREHNAYFFYSFFAFPGQPGYGVLDIGDYLSFVLLDSGHTNPIDGLQQEWLEQTLADRQDVAHIIPVYHVAAYPSHRPFSYGLAVEIRQHWVPLFEQYGVRVALEHHEHTYKRTHPIRQGAISADGIVYLGDGAWGVDTRAGDSSDEWYIDQFSSERHAIIATLQAQEQHFLVVNKHGNTIDEYTQSLQGVTAE